jgi:predicted ATPase/DNA-binding CsgD family transcriptional regulator
VAARLAPHFADGVWFVDLAPIHDPRLVVSAIGRAAGVREQRGELAQARVERLIGQRQILLVLDNFEQVLTAAQGVADLLATCPRLAILITSRAPLRLRWEYVWPLPPLALPDRRHLPPPDQLMKVAAVALYLERAQAVDPNFTLTPDNAVAIAEICVRLDGLPLAIELAAARSDVYAPGQVLVRLSQRLDILARGATDLPSRQQSLTAAFDWGYDLLPATDQALFRALAVFVGGFTLAGAREVGGSDDLTTLVQHSLVRREPGEDSRFRMLETVRVYAFERLERNGDRESISRRHAEFMLELAERAGPELLGARQAMWLAQLEREHDDLGGALRWATEHGDLELSLRLAAALWRFWWRHGHLSEGMHWLESVVDASRDAPEALLDARAAALNGAGVLAHVRGEYERALAYISESLALARRLGLQSRMAAALHNLGALAREQEEWPRARAAYEESLSIERQIDNSWGIAMSLTNLGALAADQGDPERARTLLNESLTLVRELGDRRGIASVLHNLAAVARDSAEWQRSAELYEESLALWRKLGDRWGVAASLHDLARVVEHLGSRQRAAILLGESLALFSELGIRQGTAECFVGLASLASANGQAADAARLLGAAEVLRASIGASLAARDRQDLARTVAQVRGTTPAPVLRAAWRAGRELLPDAALRQAHRLAASLSTDGQLPQPTQSEVLSRRELEVAMLVSEGLTNRQIAERLVISERTADRHVSNILAKLGVTSRAQVAAWAVSVSSPG